MQEPDITPATDLDSLPEAKKATQMIDPSLLSPSFWRNFMQRPGRHHKARAQRAKARIAKRKSKR